MTYVKIILQITMNVENINKLLAHFPSSSSALY